MAATCLQETAQLVAISKDIILGLAAISTAGVAVYGVKSWKRELTGKTEFDAANRMLQALYKVRDNFFYVRCPLILAGEFPPDFYDERKNSNQKEAEGYAYAYRNRWEFLGKALQEFDACALESEALWGNDVKSKIDDVRRCIRKLNTSIEFNIRNIASGRNELDRDFSQKIMLDISATPESDDELSVAFKAAVVEFEDTLKPHFRR